MPILFLILVLLFKPQSALASEFSVQKQINFIVTADLKLTVVEKVTLSNNFSQIYPTQYTYTITSAKPQNITAHDSGGDILVKATPQQNSTTIILKFNSPSIGKDKLTNFDLSYQLDGQINKRGQNYDLFLPASNTWVSLTKASLQVPTTLGPLVNYQGTPERISTDSLLYQLNPRYFDQPQRLLFGHQQLFNFELIYQLSNNSSDNKIYQIPLPPNTDRQKVIFSSVNPTPANVTIDRDGNYLAQYELTANQELDITAQGQVKLLPQNTQTGTTHPFHLQSQTVWPIDDTTIRTIANSLSTPQSIYDYVVAKLDYNYDLNNSQGRVGALGALANPKLSLCTEYTDLFITLSRTKGIPAREIQGYVYTTNPRLRPTNPSTDFLHAWPQYFDSGQSKWIEVDPTWGKTTNGIDYFKSLDLNHIILVIHGQDSQNPPAPGFYKRQNNLSTVNFSLADSEIVAQHSAPRLTLKQNGDKTKLAITNTTLQTISGLIINRPNWNYTAPPIPPFGGIEVDFPLPAYPLSLLPKNRNLQFSLSYQNNQYTAKLKNPKHFTHLAFTLTISAIILLTGAIIIARHYD